MFKKNSFVFLSFFAVTLVLLFSACIIPEGDTNIIVPAGSSPPAAPVDRLLPMVWVPAGTFTMGDPLDMAATPHTVRLTKGFYMGKYPVTQEQYEELMGSNPSNFHGGAGLEPAAGESQGRRPVEMVSWYDAIVFCNKLSQREKLTPVYSIKVGTLDYTDPEVWGKVPTSDNAVWDAVKMNKKASGYRLPTEAEWEYAAKGGKAPPENFLYSGSNIPDDVAWYDTISASRTHEVGIKAANALGLQDMSGNVMEWCWDWYDVYTGGAEIDPMGASSGADRILRGGSWYFTASNARIEVRNYGPPFFRAYYTGFRVVRP